MVSKEEDEEEEEQSALSWRASAGERGQGGGVHALHAGGLEGRLHAVGQEAVD